MVYHPRQSFEAGEEIFFPGTPIINDKFAVLDLLYSRDDLIKKESLFLLYVVDNLRLFRFLRFENASITEMDSDLTEIIKFGLAVRASGLLMVELYPLSYPWQRGQNDRNFLKLKKLTSETDLHLLDLLVITPGYVRSIITGYCPRLSNQVLR